MSAPGKSEAIGGCEPQPALRLNFFVYRDEHPALFDAIEARPLRHRARFVRQLLTTGFAAASQALAPATVLPTAVPEAVRGSALDELDVHAFLSLGTGSHT
jgi:hypothetical protein